MTCEEEEEEQQQQQEAGCNTITAAFGSLLWNHAMIFQGDHLYTGSAKQQQQKKFNNIRQPDVVALIPPLISSSMQSTLAAGPQVNSHDLYMGQKDASGAMHGRGVLRVRL